MAHANLGKHHGVEDQGWVAHFIIASVLKRQLSIYGNGKQVRDLLHVRDLIHAYEIGFGKMDELTGEAFNVGGGPQNTLSIWEEFGPLLEEVSGRQTAVSYGDWRPGDQPVFIADIRKAAEKLGWQPQISPVDGVLELYNWVNENQPLFK